MNSKFSLLVDEYLDVYLSFYPVKATLMGHHQSDQKLDDWSDRAVQLRLKQLQDFHFRIQGMDSSVLSYENKIDHLILKRQIAAELWELNTFQEWRNNAAFYHALMKQSILGVTLGSSTSFDQKCKALTARLKLFPRLIDQAKQNLQNPSRISVEMAIEESLSLNHLMIQTIAEMGYRCPDSMAYYGKIASNSINNYAEYLDDPLLLTSQNNLALTEFSYAQLIKNRYHIDVPVDELIAVAESEYAWCEAQLLKVAGMRHQFLFPKQDIRRLTNAEIIRKVHELIGDQYSQDDSLINDCRRIVMDIERFVDLKELMKRPQKYSLHVGRTPAWDYSQDLVQLWAPGPFEKDPIYYFYLKSLPDELDWVGQIAYLRNFNKPTLQVLAFENIIPGRLLLTSYLNANSSELRAVFPDPCFLLGWPYVSSTIMIDTGYGGYDLKIQFIHWLRYLQEVSSAIADINFHVRQFSQPEVMALLQDRGYMDVNSTTDRMKRILLRPAEPLASLYACTRIRDLHQKSRIHAGNYFSQSKFWNQLLGEAGIPFPVLFENLNRIIQQEIE